MGQLLVYGLLALVVAGGLFLLASRFLPAGEQIAPPLRDEPPWDLPAGRMLHPADVDAVRLPVALRGYRFAETDLLLDRIAGELRARDQEIARLRGQYDPAPAPLEPMSFAKPAPFEKPVPSEKPVPFEKPSVDTVEEHPVTDPSPESPSPEPRPAGSTDGWAPPPGNADADAPQPPPFDDDEQPVTDSPLDDDRR